MSAAILIFDAKHVFVKDKISGQDLFTPFRVDFYNKFVSDRLKHLIQENVIQKGIDIEEILFHSNEGILVPSEIYNLDKKEDYFRLNYSEIIENHIVVDEKIQSIEAFLISSQPKWLSTFCVENLPQTPMNNSSKKYLDKVLETDKGENDIHILLKSDSFDIIKLQNQKLYSFNCIAYDTMTDVIYFLIAHLNKFPTEAKSAILFGREKDILEVKTLFSKIEDLKNISLTTKNEKQLIQFLA